MRYKIKKMAVILFAVALSASAIAGVKEGRTAYQKYDYVTAFKELEPLVQKGNVEAQFILGAMYGDGNAMPRDEAKAVAWYRKAAEQGHVEAQFRLGVETEDGASVPKDEAKAAEMKELTEAKFSIAAEN